MMTVQGIIGLVVWGLLLMSLVVSDRQRTRQPFEFPRSILYPSLALGATVTVWFIGRGLDEVLHMLQRLLM